MFKWIREALCFDGIQDDELQPGSEWLLLTPMERLSVQSRDDAEVVQRLVEERKRTLRSAKERIAMRRHLVARGAQDAALDAIGVTVHCDDGSLRSTEDVLLDVVAALVQKTNSTHKAAAAVELFGIQGVPMLQLMHVLGGTGLKKALMNVDLRGE